MDLPDFYSSSGIAFASPTSPSVPNMVMHSFNMIASAAMGVFTTMFIVFFASYLRAEKVNVTLYTLFIGVVSWSFAFFTQWQQASTSHSDGINTSMANTECIHLITLLACFVIWFARQSREFDEEACGGGGGGSSSDRDMESNSVPLRMRRKPLSANCCCPCSTSGIIAWVITLLVGGYLTLLLMYFHWPFQSPVSSRRFSVMTTLSCSIFVFMAASVKAILQWRNRNVVQGFNGAASPTEKTKKRGGLRSLVGGCICCLCEKDCFETVTRFCSCLELGGVFLNPSQFLAYLGVLAVLGQSSVLRTIPIDEHFPTQLQTARLLAIAVSGLCFTLLVILGVRQFQEYNQIGHDEEDGEEVVTTPQGIPMTAKDTLEEEQEEAARNLRLEVRGTMHVIGSESEVAAFEKDEKRFSLIGAEERAEFKGGRDRIEFDSDSEQKETPPPRTQAADTTRQPSPPPRTQAADTTRHVVSVPLLAPPQPTASDFLLHVVEAAAVQNTPPATVVVQGTPAPSNPPKSESDFSKLLQEVVDAELDVVNAAKPESLVSPPSDTSTTTTAVVSKGESRANTQEEFSAQENDILQALTNANVTNDS